VRCALSLASCMRGQTCWCIKRCGRCSADDDAAAAVANCPMSLFPGRHNAVNGNILPGVAGSRRAAEVIHVSDRPELVQMHRSTDSYTPPNGSTKVSMGMMPDTASSLLACLLTLIADSSMMLRGVLSNHASGRSVSVHGQRLGHAEWWPLPILGCP
jgi:hypothetical protein